MPKPDGQTEYLASLFHKWTDEEGNKLTSELIETRSNTLREWYRKGQASFRLTKEQGVDQLDFLNFVQQELDGTGREGFLMGWQSDAYATDHGLTLGVEGHNRQEIDDAHFAWQD